MHIHVGPIREPSATKSAQSKPVDKIKHPAYIYLVTFVGAIGGFMFGYDTGVISGALIYVRTQMDLNEFWQELVVSVTLLSAWIASCVSNLATHKFGRKPVISWSAILLVVASLLMALATDKYMLVAGRLVAGLGIGLSSMTIPMYIAELAPNEIRGQLGVINSACLTGGQFIAALIGYGFSFIRVSLGWRFMLGLGAVPPLIQYFALYSMPESPHWLISKSKHDEARQVLRKIRSKQVDIEVEFNSIESYHQASKQQLEDMKARKEDISVFRRILKTRPVRRALVMGCLLQFVQQLSGINTVMYYTATIFQMAGINSKSNALLLSAFSASFNFTFTLVGLAVIDRVGRRKLLIPSIFGACCSLIILGLSFNIAYVYSPKITQFNNSTSNTHCSSYSVCTDCIQDDRCGFCYSPSDSRSSCLMLDPNDHSRSGIGECAYDYRATIETNHLWAYEWCPSLYPAFTLIGLILYQMSYAPGLGSLPWTINSEIYPFWARDFCQSAATGVNWSSNLLVSMTFLSLTRLITIHGAFYCYAGVTFFGLIYFGLVLPETRGKSLEEMQELFDDKPTSKTCKENDMES